MDSKILQSIGLAGLDPGIFIIIVLVLLIAVVIAFVIVSMQNKKISKLERRIQRLCAGKDGESLEAELIKLFEDNQYMMTTIGQHNICIKNIYRRLEKVYQKMKIVKYNAFDQMGGNLSFIVVLLDENNSGFLINSVYGMNTSYNFAKEIVNGTSEVELSDEEFDALEQTKEIEIPKLKK